MTKKASNKDPLFVNCNMHLILIYGVNLCLNLFSLWYSFYYLNSITKVLMMPLLMMLLWKKMGFTVKHRFIFYALFFSWMGDIFLLLQRYYSPSESRLFFSLGLFSFLVAHLAYIVCFLKDISGKNKVSLVVENPYLVLPFLAFLIVCLGYLSPNLGEMKLPIYIYAVCIIAMLLAAINRFNFVTQKSFYLICSGAILFVLSDTALAINLFIHQSVILSVFVMLTYALAQLFIVLGREN